MEITLTKSMADVVVPSSEQQLLITVGTDDVTVNIEFDGATMLGVIETLDAPISVATSVPEFISGNMYVLHIENHALSFAGTELTPVKSVNYKYSLNGNTFLPYKGGWLNDTSLLGNTRSIVYFSDAYFASMGATKIYFSFLTNAAWLNHVTASGGDEPSGDVYEYVDLGLSVLWATKNIGANAPSDSGGFFAWGETEPRTSSFNWMGYKFIEEGTTGSNNINKYQWADKKYQAIWYNSEQEFVGDGKRTLDATDDAAQVLWGGTWRMPSKAEVQELIDNCTWEWQQDYQGSGISGWLITSNVEGYTSNSIFLPAAGHYASNTISSDGEGAFIWTAELYVSSYNSETTSAYSLNAEWWDVDDFEIGMSNSIRSLGMNIRPVKIKIV